MFVSDGLAFSRMVVVLWHQINPPHHYKQLPHQGQQNNWVSEYEPTYSHIMHRQDYFYCNYGANETGALGETSHKITRMCEVTARSGEHQRLRLSGSLMPSLCTPPYYIEQATYQPQPVGSLCSWVWQVLVMMWLMLQIPLACFWWHARLKPAVQSCSFSDCILITGLMGFYLHIWR